MWSAGTHYGSAGKDPEREVGMVAMVEVPWRGLPGRPCGPAFAGWSWRCPAVAGLPLFVVSLLCVLLLPAGLGVVLAPKSLLAVRRLAGLQRRWALEWSGVTIATPYRPRPAKATNRLFGCSGAAGGSLAIRRPGGTCCGRWSTCRSAWCSGCCPRSCSSPARGRGGRFRALVADGGAHGPHGFLPQVFFLSMLPLCVIAGRGC